MSTKLLAKCALLYLITMTRSSTQTTQGSSMLACDMMVAIDSTLFKHYKENYQVVKDITQRLVDGLNNIYHNTVFTNEFHNIYFRLRNIEVLYDFCEHCNHTQQVFLNQFTKFNYNEYCIAMLFTYRDFPAGLAGLAWRGCACRENFNTGFITFLNNNQQSEEWDNIITLAHEVGHLFGATHINSSNCGDREDFIMSPTGTSHHTPKFSDCSTREIHKRLLEAKHEGCFKETEGESEQVGFCGNGIQEGMEQCDCGMDYRSCMDPCCNPGHVSPADRYWNESVRPCQHNSKFICSSPYHSLLHYGVVLPAGFVLVTVAVLAFILFRNWRGSKSLFSHLKYNQVPGVKHLNNHHQPADRASRRRSKENGFRTESGTGTTEALTISTPFLLSTTADQYIANSCTSQQSASGGRTSANKKAESVERPIIKTTSSKNPLTSPDTAGKHGAATTTTTKSSHHQQQNRQPKKESHELVDSTDSECTSFITQQTSNVFTSPSQHKPDYNPLPRRSAPLPSSSATSGQRRHNALVGEIQAKFSGDGRGTSVPCRTTAASTSQKQDYDPRPRRSAPPPPK